jgi:hypothetical protein
MRTLLSCIGVSIASVVATVALFFVYATVHDAGRREGKTRVPFSDLVTEVELGRVDEIRVDGRVYTYRIHGGEGRNATKETLGPKADMTALRTLRPTDPSLPAPSIDAR